MPLNNNSFLGFSSNRLVPAGGVPALQAVGYVQAATDALKRLDFEEERRKRDEQRKLQNQLARDAANRQQLQLEASIKQQRVQADRFAREAKLRADRFAREAKLKEDALADKKRERETIKREREKMLREVEKDNPALANELRMAFAGGVKPNQAMLDRAFGVEPQMTPDQQAKIKIEREKLALLRKAQEQKDSKAKAISKILGGGGGPGSPAPAPTGGAPRPASSPPVAASPPTPAARGAGGGSAAAPSFAAPSEVLSNYINETAAEITQREQKAAQLAAIGATSEAASERRAADLLRVRLNSAKIKLSERNDPVKRFERAKAAAMLKRLEGGDLSVIGIRPPKEDKISWKEALSQASEEVRSALQSDPEYQPSVKQIQDTVSKRAAELLRGAEPVRESVKALIKEKDKTGQIEDLESATERVLQQAVATGNFARLPAEIEDFLGASGEVYMSKPLAKMITNIVVASHKLGSDDFSASLDRTLRTYNGEGPLSRKALRKSIAEDYARNLTRVNPRINPAFAKQLGAVSASRQLRIVSAVMSSMAGTAQDKASITRRLKKTLGEFDFAKQFAEGAVTEFIGPEASLGVGGPKGFTGVLGRYAGAITGKAPDVLAAAGAVYEVAQTGGFGAAAAPLTFAAIKKTVKEGGKLALTKLLARRGAVALAKGAAIMGGAEALRQGRRGALGFGVDAGAIAKEAVAGAPFGLIGGSTIIGKGVSAASAGSLSSMLRAKIEGRDVRGAETIRDAALAGIITLGGDALVPRFVRKIQRRIQSRPVSDSRALVLRDEIQSVREGLNRPPTATPAQTFTASPAEQRFQNLRGLLPEASGAESFAGTRTVPGRFSPIEMGGAELSRPGSTRPPVRREAIPLGPESTRALVPTKPGLSGGAIVPPPGFMSKLELTRAFKLASGNSKQKFSAYIEKLFNKYGEAPVFDLLNGLNDRGLLRPGSKAIELGMGEAAERAAFIKEMFTRHALAGQ